MVNGDLSAGGAPEWPDSPEPAVAVPLAHAVLRVVWTVTEEQRGNPQQSKLVGRFFAGVE
jgi:hypothetical protein